MNPRRTGGERGKGRLLVSVESIATHDDARARLTHDDRVSRSIRSERAMTLVPLSRIATARSGDKGEGSNVGVMARSDAAYAFLKRQLDAERVKKHMSAINFGPVKRYEADNL